MQDEVLEDGEIAIYYSVCRGYWVEKKKTIRISFVVCFLSGVRRGCWARLAVGKCYGI